MAKKKSRKFLTLSLLVLLGAALTFAFWPRPQVVDIGRVERGTMTISIDEEGRTRVRDAYLISTPTAGRLLRVEVEPGDPVVGGETVVALMLPDNPLPLDARSRAQAEAEVVAAEAALRLARADRNQAVANKELAEVELARTRRLRETNLESQAALDRARRQALTSEAALTAADAAIVERQAALASARALLIRYAGQPAADGDKAVAIKLRAPSGGRVLRVIQESETPLAAGTAVLEIGDTDSDLEVLVELLSSDAVQVSPQDKVTLTGWGGAQPLSGVVERIEPWGFTKVSSLGVEEQRVNTIIRLTDPAPARKKLGHGFRVEAKILVWEQSDTLLVPSSALFRAGKDWAVFQVSDGKAGLRQVEIGPNNGVTAQLLSGLKAGDRVVLYPSSELSDGIKVAQREIESG